MARYFITGHTGFKGAWLTFLLKSQGHEVSGLGLDPLPGSIFDRTALERDLIHDFRIDVRDREETIKALQKAKPDYVIHMAAQALVREGYRNPRYTYETNVLGTLNVLEAVDHTDSVRAQLIVTTDKVYLNQGLNRPYVETDPLGGKDPYSASKAMADVLAQEYLARNGAKPGAVARAGNVIGAGDVSRDRLFADIGVAFSDRRTLVIRNPTHVRPWQHVLDCLDGYLTLIASSSAIEPASSWNIGPRTGDQKSVADVLHQIETLGARLEVHLRPVDDFGEDPNLLLDSSKIRGFLGWSGRLGGRSAIDWALRSIVNPGLDLRTVIDQQITAWKTLEPVAPRSASIGLPETTFAEDAKMHDT